MRLVLWLGLLTVTLGTLGAAHVLDGRARPWRPPAEQPFRPSIRTVDGGSIAGIRIGEPIRTVVANAGGPTVLNAALPVLLEPAEERAEWDGAAVYYDATTRRVTAVDVSFSTGIQTSRGDTLGTPESVVRTHYPDAVPYESSCAWNSVSLLLRTPNPNYVLDLSFIRRRLQSATLVAWPKFIAVCWRIHDRRAMANPLS